VGTNSPSEGNVTGEQPTSNAALRSGVNERVVHVARKSFAPDQEWEFFCECGHDDCHEHVSLTVDAYAALHDSGRAVLANGHELSQTERSRRLRGDADALTRQAEHQARRARKNLSDGSDLVRGKPPAAGVGTGRVLVVDDSDAFLGAAAAVLARTRELGLVGTTTSGPAAIELMPSLRPDLVLLDIHMPGLDGIETARIIHRRYPKTVIVLVSTDPEGNEAAARSVGAAALLSKADLRPGTLDSLWLKHLLGT
jgi:two-component system, NarL family, invasion response regulator UvrY